MDSRTVIAVILVVAAFVVIAGFLIARQRRSQHLKQQFGPEYDRAVAQHGDTRQAEAVLIDRERRVERFALRPLTALDRERYAEEWGAVQRLFVDDPSNAVIQADTLVKTVLAARGYPMGEAEQRTADLSVEYPLLVQNYRSARAIMLRHSQGQTSTEELRLAMVNFRSLFDELLETAKPQRVGDSHERIAS